MCCYTGPPKTLFDRILDWSEPAALIAPAVAAVALVVMTPSSISDPVVRLLAAGLIYIVLLLPVGLAAAFLTLVVAVLAAAIQATWSALRR